MFCLLRKVLLTQLIINLHVLAVVTSWLKSLVSGQHFCDKNTSYAVSSTSILMIVSIKIWSNLNFFALIS